MIELIRAELHGELFLNGKNLAKKLDRERHGMKDLMLVYDRKEKELLVTWQGETAIVPNTNIVSMIEGKPEKEIHPFVAAPMQKISAQVSSPQSHVFAGEGHGKTGKDK